MEVLIRAPWKQVGNKGYLSLYLTTKDPEEAKLLREIVGKEEKMIEIHGEYQSEIIGEDKQATAILWIEFHPPKD